MTSKNYQEYNKRYREANKEAIRLYNKKYREDNKAAAKLYSKAWKAKNKDEIREYNKLPEARYRSHKSSAKHRGVEFKLSFDEWLWFWNGHWDKRGGLGHQLCMCRKGDKGAYELGNIYLDTNSNNIELRHELKGAVQ